VTIKEEHIQFYEETKIEKRDDPEYVLELIGQFVDEETAVKVMTGAYYPKILMVPVMERILALEEQVHLLEFPLDSHIDEPTIVSDFPK